MKRILSIILLSVFIFAFSSCDTVEQTSENSINENVDIYDFFLNDNVPNISLCYHIDNKGNFYYFNIDTLSIHSINPSGNEKIYDISDAFKNASFISINSIQASENNIYFSSTDRNSSNLFYIFNYDIKKNEIKTIFEYSSPELQTGKMIKIKDFLVFLLKDIDYASNAAAISPNESLHYTGERIKIFDLKTNNIVDLNIDFPINFSTINDDEIMIQAYDEMSGYYFISYDFSTMIFAEKYNFKEKNVLDFAVLDKNNYIVYTTILNNNLYLSDLNDSEHYTTILNDEEIIRNSITMRNDKLYYLKSDSQSSLIFSQYNFSLQEFLNKSINIIGDTSVLPGLGYNINSSIFNNEEFSLKVLSADSDWDICITSTDFSHAENIKRNSIYEPLNQIPGAEDFFSNYVPYLQEIAKLDNNDIWMLPYSTGGKWLIYTDDININVTNDYYELSQNLIKSKGESELINHGILYNHFITPSLRYYATFFEEIEDRDFEYFAKFIKDEMLGSNKLISTNTEYSELYSSIPYDNTLIKNKRVYQIFKPNKSLVLSIDIYSKREINDCMNEWEAANVIPIPNAFDTYYNFECNYIYVNPHSKNKDKVFDYISNLFAYLLENDNSFMFNNPDLYNNSSSYNFMQSINDNIKITFSIPDELFLLDFQKYLNDELSLDEMLKNIKNNLLIYKNE